MKIELYEKLKSALLEGKKVRKRSWKRKNAFIHTMDGYIFTDQGTNPSALPKLEDLKRAKGDDWVVLDEKQKR